MADGEPGWRPRDSPHAPERRVEVYQKRAEQRQNRREQQTRNGASSDRAVVVAGRGLHDRSLTRQRSVEELLRVRLESWWCGAQPMLLVPIFIEGEEDRIILSWKTGSGNGQQINSICDTTATVTNPVGRTRVELTAATHWFRQCGVSVSERSTPAFPMCAVQSSDCSLGQLRSKLLSAHSIYE